jgi:putative flippase GtrA
MKRWFGHAEFARVFRFAVTGGMATVTSYLTFVLMLRAAGAPYVLAYIAACVVGIVLGYVVNSGWTFKRTQSRSLQQGLLYASTQVGILTVMGWLLTCEVGKWHWRPEVAALINVPLSAGIGFVLMRWGVFRKVSLSDPPGECSERR